MRPISVFGDVQMNPSQVGIAEHGSASGRRYPRSVIVSQTPTGAVLDVPAIAKELGVRFADAGHRALSGRRQRA